MTPMTYNGVECVACGDEFETLSEYEDHDCDADNGVVETYRGP